MTVIKTMTIVGLFGLAMHFGHYWAAGGLVTLFVLLIVAAKRSAKAKAERVSGL